MDELRRNNFVKIILSTNEVLQGKVADYSADRVLVLIAPESLELAKKMHELDEADIYVYTHLGVKQMKSAVISALNKFNCITFENSPTVKVVQKRAFVRVASNLKFKLTKNDVSYDCSCVNISAGGVAFWLRNSDVKIGDLVTIFFPKKDFERDITAQALIIKNNSDWFVAKYIDLNTHDEDKIVKYVFKTMVKY